MITSEIDEWTYTKNLAPLKVKGRHARKEIYRSCVLLFSKPNLVWYKVTSMRYTLWIEQTTYEQPHEITLHRGVLKAACPSEIINHDNKIDTGLRNQTSQSEHVGQLAVERYIRFSRRTMLKLNCGNMKENFLRTIKIDVSQICSFFIFIKFSF